MLKSAKQIDPSITGLIADRDGIRGKGDGPGGGTNNPLDALHNERFRSARKRADDAKRAYNDARNLLNRLKKMFPGIGLSDPRLRDAKDAINIALRNQAQARKELKQLGHPSLHGKLKQQAQPLIKPDDQQAQAIVNEVDRILKERKAALGIKDESAKPPENTREKLARRQKERQADVDKWNAQVEARRAAEKAKQEQIARDNDFEPGKLVSPDDPNASPFLKGDISGQARPIGQEHGNINGVYKVDIKDNGEGYYKPAAGENKDAAPYTGTMAHREVMAYEVDKLIGFGLVPETKLVRGPQGVGSVQSAVENARVGAAASMRDFMGKPENHEQASDMLAFDYITSNGDRHGNNYMVDEANNKLHLIDNGMLFKTKAEGGWEARNNAVVNYGHMISEEAAERTRQKLVNFLENPTARTELLTRAKTIGVKIPDKELLSVFKRAHVLAEDNNWLGKVISFNKR